MDKSQIAEMKHSIKSSMNNRAGILIELAAAREDGTCYSENIPLDKEDVMNATHIFTSIISNYVLHNDFNGGLSYYGIEITTDRHIEFATKLHELILGYSGINTKTYYK